MSLGVPAEAPDTLRVKPQPACEKSADCARPLPTGAAFGKESAWQPLDSAPRPGIAKRQEQTEECLDSLTDGTIEDKKKPKTKSR